MVVVVISSSERFMRSHCSLRKIMKWEQQWLRIF